MKNHTAFDWEQVYDSLNSKGFAMLPAVLTKDECAQVAGRYQEVTPYRKVISMQRYRFGQGEYKYYDYPLPDIIQSLRSDYYIPLARLANEWMHLFGIDRSFPPEHKLFVEQCVHKDQIRPTPLILRYVAGGYNTLHQDLYGEIFFPFQLVVMLTQQHRDHEGGEFILTEQVPRAQSRATVVQPGQGDAVIFTTNFRPVKGSRGFYQAKVKHGISEVTSGTRFALGIIFHDAV